MVNCIIKSTRLDSSSSRGHDADFARAQGQETHTRNRPDGQAKARNPKSAKPDGWVGEWTLASEQGQVQDRRETHRAAYCKQKTTKRKTTMQKYLDTRYLGSRQTAKH